MFHYVTKLGIFSTISVFITLTGETFSPVFSVFWVVQSFSRFKKDKISCVKQNTPFPGQKV